FVAQVLQEILDQVLHVDPLILEPPHCVEALVRFRRTNVQHPTSNKPASETPHPRTQVRDARWNCGLRPGRSFASYLRSQMTTNELAWYVAHTRPRCEKKLAEYCQREGFAVTLPCYRTVHKYRGKT